MTTLQAIQQIVASQNREIIFNDPVRVKKTPHELVFTCYGVHAEDDGIWLMDGEGKWHGPLGENQGNAMLVINSLYQRLKAMQMELA